MINQLNLIINFCVFNRLLYIVCIQKKIQLNKEVLVRDIEQTQDAMIPYVLSQDQYPVSFRFYDPILRIIKNDMSQAKKDWFQRKNQLSKEFYSGGFMTDLKAFLVGEGKLISKQIPVNKKERNEIDINDPRVSSTVR